MKNIKKFYREHRVFTILMAVVIVCAILIGTLLFQCFYTGGKDKYGDRLENIEKYEIKTKKLEDVEKKITAEETVKKADLFITGRIVYSRIDFETEVDIQDAKNIAIKILDEFSDDEKSYYDFHFSLKKAASETSAKFNIEGAKNRNGSGLSWVNNREVEETKE